MWPFRPARFLTHASFAVNGPAAGPQLFANHLFNILVHISCAFLVFGMVRLLSRTPVLKPRGLETVKSYWALFAGLLFVVHPVQTQAVTYLTQRAVLLSGLGCLGTTVLYLVSRLKETEGRGQGFFWYSLSLLAALLTMLTRENAVILPVLLGLLEGVFFKPAWKKILPFLAVALVALLGTVLTGSPDAGLRKPDGMSVLTHFLTQARVVLTYMRLTVFPFGQRLHYHYPVYSSLRFGPLAGLCLVISLIVLAWKQRAKRPLFSFGIAWFLVGLLPESGFIPLREVILEHRMYLPMAGFCLLIPSRIWELVRKKTRWAVAGLAVMVLFFSLRAYNRNEVWSDPKTFQEDSGMPAGPAYARLAVSPARQSL